VSPSPSPEDGNRCSFLKAVSSSYLEFRMMDKVQKHSDLCIIRTLQILQIDLLSRFTLYRVTVTEIALLTFIETKVLLI
jgi:hypothetical protein